MNSLGGVSYGDRGGERERDSSEESVSVLSCGGETATKKKKIDKTTTRNFASLPFRL